MQNTSRDWLSIQADANSDPMTISVHVTPFQGSIETLSENWTVDIPIRKVHLYINTDSVSRRIALAIAIDTQVGSGT